MAEIYLMHYRHGIKIATMEMEAQYDEQNGWVRFDPDEMVADVLPETNTEANVMADTPRRRGRPRADKDD